jgi:hypothetical protein
MGEIPSFSVPRSKKFKSSYILVFLDLFDLLGAYDRTGIEQ